MGAAIRRLAVLIDADNTSPSQCASIFEELVAYGNLTVKRAYGDWTNSSLAGWKHQLHRHAISPIQQFSNTVGKNATDSALIIDAMDLLHAGNVDGFVLVSSDADFTRLATRLRESGMTVFGVGRRETPTPFVRACDRFIHVKVLDRNKKSQPDRQTPVGANAGPRHLQSLLTRTLHRTQADDEHWTGLAELGSQLSRTEPSFDPRTHGFAKLSDLVRKQPYLETRNVSAKSGGAVQVRVKGTRTKSAANPSISRSTAPAPKRQGAETIGAA